MLRWGVGFCKLSSTSNDNNDGNALSPSASWKQHGEKNKSDLSLCSFHAFDDQSTPTNAPWTPTSTLCTCSWLVCIVSHFCFLLLTKNWWHNRAAQHRCPAWTLVSFFLTMYQQQRANQNTEVNRRLSFHKTAARSLKKPNWTQINKFVVSRKTWWEPWGKQHVIQSLAEFIAS